MADRSISYEFRGRFENLQAGLSSASRSVRDFGTNLTGLDRRGDQMRRGLDRLGGTAGRFALAAGAGFVAAATSAANFEQRMSFVQAATHETAANMGLLRQAALDAGQSTVFSATEAAGAIEALAKAGLSTKDILAGGLAGALDLAAAGTVDVSQAAEIAATTLNQFGLAGDQTSHVADVLAAAAGKAQGEVTDMAQALKYVGPVAAQMGISLEETSGAIAELAAQGILGDQAGTSLRGMLTALTSPSKLAASEMEALGIKLYDAHGKFVGLDGVAGRLHRTMSGLTAAERDQSLGRIFGNEQITAARILYAGGAEAVRKWTKAVDDQGYAAATAHLKMNNLKGDLEQLGGALETLLITGGSGQGGAFRGMTQKATEFVNVLNGLPGPVKTTTVALVGLAAVSAGGFWFTSKAVSAMAETRLAMQALGLQAATTRQVLTTLGAGAATLSVATLAGIDVLGRTDTWQRSREAADATAKSYEDLADALKKSNVGKYADDLGIDMARLAQDLYENGKGGEYAQKVLAELAETTDGFGNGVKGVAGDIIPGWTSATNKAYEANKDLGNILERSKGVLGSASDEAKEAALAQSGLSGSARDLAQSSAMSADDVRALADAMQKAGEKADSASGSFLDLSAGMKDGKFSFSDWITELERAGDAVANFRKNADKALDRGIPQGLVNSLEEMGAAGAVQLDHLANATPAQIRRIIAAWKRWENQSGETTDAITNDLTNVGTGVDGVDGKVKNLGKRKAKPTAELRADAFEAKHRQIDQDLRGLTGKKASPKVDANKKTFDLKLGDVRGALAGLDKQFVAPTIGVEDRATGIIGSIRRGLESIRDKVVHVTTVNSGKGSADGGTVPNTGLGYADRHPYLLADGEEVVSNRYGQADRWRPILKAINAGRLADGGTTGLANGGTARRLPGLGFADLPSLNLVEMGLKALARTLSQSQKALEKEKDQRQAVVDKMQGLSSDVAGKFLSDLFGGETDAWRSAVGGTSFAQVMSTINADTAGGTALQKDIAALKRKGLDGPALDELLRRADPATIDQWAHQLSRGQLAQYERGFENRQAVATTTGRQAGVAAYGAELKQQTHEMRTVAHRVERVEKAIRQEEQKTRRANQRGASRAQQKKRRD